ncbi:MAG: TSUP family transporter [Phycisphaerae bacterium]|nr:TSUP family transporter [Phycisphaerae bacterium]
MIDPYIAIALFTAGLVSGFVDSIAGGGGLITVPVLLLVGLDPKAALATNKFQASFGSSTATWQYYRHGHLDVRSALPGVVVTFIAAACGTLTVRAISPDMLGKIVPIAMGVILVYTVISPKLGHVARKPLLGRYGFYALLGMLLGFYDGFFGPGTGAFWTMAFMVFLGHEMPRATGHTKLMNFTSNIASLLFFLSSGLIRYSYGLAMAAGQLIGARAGATMASRRGTKFIRPVFLTVVAIVTVHLIWKYFFASAT